MRRKRSLGNHRATLVRRGKNLMGSSFPVVHIPAARHVFIEKVLFFLLWLSIFLFCGFFKPSNIDIRGGSRILVRGAAEFWLKRGALSPKFAQTGVFPLKLLEHCMILKKGQEASGYGWPFSKCSVLDQKISAKKWVFEQMQILAASCRPTCRFPPPWSGLLFFGFLCTSTRIHTNKCLNRLYTGHLSWERWNIWYLRSRLVCPTAVSLLPLSPRSPERPVPGERTNLMDVPGLRKETTHTHNHGEHSHSFR